MRHVISCVYESWHMSHFSSWAELIDTCHISHELNWHMSHFLSLPNKKACSPSQIISLQLSNTGIRWTTMAEAQLHEQWHIIFAKPDMISILSEVKNWCIDATFKVICKPFTQLFSIHAFIKSGERAKQMAWKSILECLLQSLSWSVFGRAICTNNYVEGWHHNLNQKAKKGQLPFYLLVHLLHEETKWINIQVCLVLENKITCQEEWHYRMVQSKVLTITQCLFKAGE